MNSPPDPRDPGGEKTPAAIPRRMGLQGAEAIATPELPQQDHRSKIQHRKHP